MLKANRISHTFEGRKILDDISLDIRSKEVCAIMGMSGTGKSTLLKILAGKLKADEGEVLFHEEAIPDPEKVLVAGLEDIQYVAQDFNLSAKRTVYENLNLSLLAYEEEFKAQQIEWLLGIMRLEPLAHQKIEKLSGGEKQRLAIACALAVEPEVLMLDEPFTQLDLFHADILIEALQSVKEELDIAILLVSHQPREIFHLADRLLILHGGCIQQSGEPLEVYNFPNSLEVARLFGPINRINRNGQQLLVRPTDLFYKQEKHEELNFVAKAIIKEITFTNFNWLLTVTNNQQQYYLYSTQKPNLTRGEDLFIYLNESALIKDGSREPEC